VDCASDEELKKDRKKSDEKYVPDEFSSLERLDGEGDRTIQ